MRDILTDTQKWLDSSEDVGLATVISTWGSAPRGVGAKMAFTQDGKLAGSVSGGCVEGSVFEEGLEVLGGAVPKLLHYGVADETAWDVGLACGGQIDIFVERLDPIIFNFASGLIVRDTPFALSTIISGPPDLVGKKLVVERGGRMFGVIRQDLDGVVAAVARSQLGDGSSAVKQINVTGSDTGLLELFIEIIFPAPTLIVVGGVHIAISLTNIAKNLGYRTIVVDPRRAFGSQSRFPHVDQLIQMWPAKAFEQIPLTPSTAIVVLSHDPKIDDPAVKQALASQAFYIGALGSRTTHSKRIERLQTAGIPAEDLNRIHGPIGLDIGANTPEEIAVAIMAEIIAARAVRK